MGGGRDNWVLCRVYYAVMKSEGTVEDTGDAGDAGDNEDGVVRMTMVIDD